MNLFNVLRCTPYTEFPILDKISSFETLLLVGVFTNSEKPRKFEFGAESVLADALRNIINENTGTTYTVFTIHYTFLPSGG